jgi:tRNA-(ms[2]io[6]A)-hydroxylase
LQGSGEDDGDERPPWHWVALGVVATFVVWLPLAGLANTVLQRMLERATDTELPPSVRLAMVGLNVLAFVIAGAAGGYLVGRFGGRAGQREASASGVVVATIAWGIALTQEARAGVLGWSVLLVVMVTIGSAASYAGGRAGIRRRALGERSR